MFKRRDRSRAPEIPAFLAPYRTSNTTRVSQVGKEPVERQRQRTQRVQAAVQ